MRYVRSGGNRPAVEPTPRPSGHPWPDPGGVDDDAHLPPRRSRDVRSISRLGEPPLAGRLVPADRDLGLAHLRWPTVDDHDRNEPESFGGSHSWRLNPDVPATVGLVQAEAAVLHALVGQLAVAEKMRAQPVLDDLLSGSECRAQLLWVNHPRPVPSAGSRCAFVLPGSTRRRDVTQRGEL